MLLDLPAEIILSVTSFLSFGNKLNLITTCRKLNELISKTTLFENINLMNHGTDAEKIIQEFNKSPHKGAQVKTLMLDVEALPEDMIPQLSSIFPNVTRFIIDDDNERSESTSGPLSEPIATWVNTLEAYSTDDGWFPIWHALECHTFPRLTELDINEDGDGDFTLITKPGYKAPHLLSYIKNAPSLEKLSIKRLDLTLDFLEEMHSSCPHIKSLSLYGNMFIVNNTALPEVIVPAKSVTYLKIDRMDCFDMNGLFLDYILKKYPHLQHLCIIPEHHLGSAAGTLDMYYPGSFDYFEDNVDSEEEEDFGITTDEYDKLISNFKSTLDIYRASAKQFFTRIPKAIKSLEVSIDSFSDVMEILSTADIKPVQLNVKGLYGPLKNKSKTRTPLGYLKYMTSVKTMEMSIVPPVKALNQREFMSTSVTKLIVNSKGNALRIDWLLSVFPLLEDLCIKGFGINVVEVGDQRKVHSQKVYPNLRKIKMQYIQVQQKIFDFLKKAAPNLKDLDLTVGVKSNSKSNSNTNSNSNPYSNPHSYSCPHSASTTKGTIHRLDVSNWNLEKCYIDVFDSRGVIQDRDYKITIEDTTRRLIIPLYRDMITFPFKGYSHPNREGILCVDIKSDNVEDLRLSGRGVKKIDDDILIII